MKTRIKRDQDRHVIYSRKSERIEITTLIGSSVDFSTPAKQKLHCDFFLLDQKLEEQALKS